jgi:hypothetical protein
MAFFLGITIFNGKIHYKSPFSIAMLVYQRVGHFWWSQGPISFAQAGEAQTSEGASLSDPHFATS